MKVTKIQEEFLIANKCTTSTGCPGSPQVSFYWEYVLDLVESKSVRECDLYNYHQIKKTVNDFYSGYNQQELHVNQWLAFELWRSNNRL